MEVILLEHVRNLGHLGDKVKIKAGYGRNFLIPKKKAVFATPENIALFEQRRAEFEKKAAAELAEAEKRATVINKTTLVIPVMASEEGKLYGSIGVVEIVDAASAQGLEISKREVTLVDGALHSIGDYEIQVQIHSEVTAQLQVQIIAGE